MATQDSKGRNLGVQDAYGAVQKPENIPGTQEYKNRLVCFMSCFLITDIIFGITCLACGVYSIFDHWVWAIFCLSVVVSTIWACFCYFIVKKTNMSLPTSNAVLKNYFYYRFFILGLTVVAAICMVIDSLHSSSMIRVNVSNREAWLLEQNEMYSNRSVYTAVFATIYMIWGIIIGMSQYTYLEAVNYWKNNFVFADQGNPYSP